VLRGMKVATSCYWPLERQLRVLGHWSGNFVFWAIGVATSCFGPLEWQIRVMGHWSGNFVFWAIGVATTCYGPLERQLRVMRHWSGNFVLWALGAATLCFGPIEWQLMLCAFGAITIKLLTSTCQGMEEGAGGVFSAVTFHIDREIILFLI
jgi:hypothetical protein